MSFYKIYPKGSRSCLHASYCLLNSS